MSPSSLRRCTVSPCVRTPFRPGLGLPCAALGFRLSPSSPLAHSSAAYFPAAGGPLHRGGGCGRRGKDRWAPRLLQLLAPHQEGQIKGCHRNEGRGHPVPPELVLTCSMETGAYVCPQNEAQAWGWSGPRASTPEPLCFVLSGPIFLCCGDNLICLLGFT